MLRSGGGGIHKILMLIIREFHNGNEINAISYFSLPFSTLSISSFSYLLVWGRGISIPTPPPPPLHHIHQSRLGYLPPVSLYAICMSYFWKRFFNNFKNNFFLFIICTIKTNKKWSFLFIFCCCLFPVIF